MSLLSSIILPKLEKELTALEPQAAQFLLGELKSMSADVLAWAENKASSSDQNIPQ